MPATGTRNHGKNTERVPGRGKRGKHGDNPWITPREKRLTISLSLSYNRRCRTSEGVRQKNGIQDVIRARRSTQEAEEAPLLRV